ncbi:Type II secretion system F domain-containing protein [Spirochaeta thermophila DSM 6578]|uniref:Type II secretion system F domain-containing protein n=1 Tax=Winmispira thermophila (strain ATCC 700085 / DSM 6578 / Z-1203) TaxID=869211 RepID=G0GAU3_WINT7|nr:type II secretion system F family protein [Spirochaeta thermophila]AEJ61839.1 Type II secretion system F domain-containing protein [Spirochaeta thermophila DSM 6578]
MNKYEVRFVSKEGALKVRTLVASSVEECERVIAREGGAVIEVKPKAIPLREGKIYGFPVLVEFTRLLARLLAASLTVRDALVVIGEVGARKDVREIAMRLVEEIDKGNRFQSALTVIWRNLPPVYTGLIAVGERTGNLPGVYSQLSHYVELRKKVKDKVGGVLVYPLIVLAVAFFVGIGLFGFAVPRLESVFAELGGEAASHLHTSLSQARLFGGILLSVISVFLCLFLLVRVMRRRGRSWALLIDRWKVRLPLIGALAMKREMFDFCFAMEVLSKGGVSVDEALGVAAESVENAALREEVSRARARVMKGASLAEVLGGSSLIPAVVRQWVGVGERTGATEEVFAHMRRFFGEELEQEISVLLNLMEPLTSVIIGMFILILVLVFIVPIFTTYGSLL